VSLYIPKPTLFLNRKIALRMCIKSGARVLKVSDTEQNAEGKNILKRGKTEWLLFYLDNKTHPQISLGR
jgi:hypothetical protein